MLQVQTSAPSQTPSHAPPHTPASGPTLVRLLTHLTQVDAPAPRQSLAAQLGEWLGWTDAVALSSAFNGGVPALAPGRVRAGNDAASDCARVRKALAGAIADSGAPSGKSRAPSRVQPPPDSDMEADYATHRQRYLLLQQSMESAIAALRGRLRATLAARGPDMARLAAVDTVMERVLGEREQALLITVPSMLEPHFERLRQAEAQSPDPCAGGPAPAPHAAPAWLRTFRADMRAVLLAELDVRFQPIEGLLAALRAS